VVRQSLPGMISACIKIAENNPMDLTDMYSTFHPKAKEYTFFSAPYATFSKIGHKSGLKRNKNIEIIPCTLSVTTD
jgi:hypothetical protein